MKRKWEGLGLMRCSLFWVVLFGIFGKLYLPEDCEGNGECGRMKTGVWFDMLGMIFWFGSFVGECLSPLHLVVSASY